MSTCNCQSSKTSEVLVNNIEPKSKCRAAKQNATRKGGTFDEAGLTG